MKNYSLEAALKEAKALCNGRGSANAVDLLNLIAVINPTGRAISERNIKNRYELKTQLQNLLIAQFVDDLNIQLDGADPNTVGIWHRYEAAPSTHTIIDQLDDDCQMILRRLLDDAALDGKQAHHKSKSTALGGAPSSVSTHAARRLRQESPPITGVSFLAQAHAALEEYDFELAEGLFRQALAASNGAPDAASALIAFYIDHVAAYESAWNLAQELPVATRRHGLVRPKIAVAAAHLGHETEALELLAGVDGWEKNEALLILTAKALAELRPVAAAARLQEINRSALPEQKVQAALLSDQLEACFMTAFAPKVREMLDLYEAKERTRATQVAREILQKWPGCQAAKRVL